MCGFISGICILLHWSICLSLYQYHVVLVTVALKYILKSGRLMPPSLFFFLNITFPILSLFLNLGLFSISLKKSHFMRPAAP